MKIFFACLSFFFVQSSLFAQACSPEALEVRPYFASETDDNIEGELLRHRVYYNPDCPSNNKLLLHMVGTYDNPNSTIFFPSLAANNGFKAISLKYPNLISATELCRNSNDLDCYTKFHEELIYGLDSSDGLEVNPVESIYNRIQKLLFFLVEEFPLEGWDEFLTSNNDINWSRVILSGHSQGGGHAAYLAKNHLVDRVITFASPNEFSEFFQSTAPWLGEAGATPDDRFFAFANVFDDVVDYNEQYQCWDAMNITSFGDTLNVDQALCPFEGTHLLYTSEIKDEGLRPNHNLMIIDSDTPIEEGIPVFEPVWKYLLDICSTSSIHGINNTLKANVFPNPVTDILTIESEETINEIQIYNTQGITLLTQNSKSKISQLDMNGLQGLVFVKLISDFNKVEIFKLMVL